MYLSRKNKNGGVSARRERERQGAREAGSKRERRRERGSEDEREEVNLHNTARYY